MGLFPHHGDREMANVCSEYIVHGCPASQYLVCPAHAIGRNCWETARKPCCKVTDRGKCLECEVYRRGRNLRGNGRWRHAITHQW